MPVLAIQLKTETIINLCERVIDQAERERKEIIRDQSNEMCKKYNFWRKLFFASEPIKPLEFYNLFKDTHPLMNGNHPFEEEAKNILFYFKHREQEVASTYDMMSFETFMAFKTYLDEGISDPKL